jgi:hypothetical protein
MKIAAADRMITPLNRAAARRPPRIEQIHGICTLTNQYAYALLAFLRVPESLCPTLMHGKPLNKPVPPLRGANTRAGLTMVEIEIWRIARPMSGSPHRRARDTHRRDRRVTATTQCRRRADQMEVHHPEGAGQTGTGLYRHRRRVTITVQRYWHAFDSRQK